MRRRSSRIDASCASATHRAASRIGVAASACALGLLLAGHTGGAEAGAPRSPSLPEAAYRETRVNATSAPGAALFRAHCATCHSASAVAAGTAALQIKYEGRVPAALEERTDLTREFVGYVVRNGTNVMPFFRKTELSDADVAAIAAHLARK